MNKKIDKIIKIVNRQMKEETNLNFVYQKKIGQIEFDELFTLDSIIISAKKCSSGFMHKRDTKEFMSNI
jgi:hypothetical protein